LSHLNQPSPNRRLWPTDVSPAIEVITPALLRQWPLPAVKESKYGRGQVLVVGGAARTPGAALLAGLAVLRVGAGHLTLGVAESAAIPIAVTMPESGVVGLSQNALGSVQGSDLEALADTIGDVDVVVVGPGLDDADETATLLRELVPLLGGKTQLVLDAYALGALAEVPELSRATNGRLILTPNKEEAEHLLGREVTSLGENVAEIAERYDCVVSCKGQIADRAGKRWQISSGQEGLATSGSGDVLAGAIAGLVARGATLPQAACWGTHLHAAAGDRLASRVGLVGFLARELLDELPLILVELSS
jgi:ADP-dependent NAD(P)H-hydrate dehydratase